MKPEEIFIQRLKTKLDESLAEIPQHIEARLNQSRFLALQKRPPKPQSSVVGQNILALRFDFFQNKTMLFLLASLIVAISLGTFQYLQIQDEAQVAADIDEEILSNDAPIQSYTDPAFFMVFRSGLLKKD